MGVKKGLKWKFQKCFLQFSRLFQGFLLVLLQCFKEVFRVFQECFNELMFFLFCCCVLVIAATQEERGLHFLDFWIFDQKTKVVNNRSVSALTHYELQNSISNKQRFFT